LVHVLDITHPNAAYQAQTVDDTLAELGLAAKSRVTALNKVDQLSTPDGRPIAGLEELAHLEPSLTQHRPDAVLISAARGWGLDELLRRIGEELARAAAERPKPVARAAHSAAPSAWS
jgi:GTP-binding protein HflX